MNELETKVKAAITKMVKRVWPTAWAFMPVQTGFGKTGVPDHLFCVPVTVTLDMVGKTYGMFVGVEAKRTGKKPTPNQKRELLAILAAKGFATATAGLEEVPELEIKLKERFCQKS